MMKNTFFFTTFLFLLLSTIVWSQSLTSVDPDTGEQCQKLTITVTGENTNFYQGTSTMWLDHEGSSINPASNTVISPTVIEGVFYFNTSHTTGNYDVHAYNGSGSGDMMLPDSFLLQAVENIPQLSLAEPGTAYLGDTILMDITGAFTHFDVEGVNNSVMLTSGDGGSLGAYSLTVIDALHLQAAIYIYYGNPIGSYTLHVSNKLDGNMNLPDALIIMEGQDAPEIVSVEPNSASQGEALTLTITGKNTTFQQGTSNIKLSKSGLGTIYPVARNVVNDTTMTGEFNFSFDDDPGDYDVTVINWALGDVSLTDGFHLLAQSDTPNLLSVTPDSAHQGTRVTLLIKAENTQFDKEGNTALVTLRLEGEEIFCKNVRVINSVTLEAEYVFSYSNWTGLRDLEVKTPLDGTMILENSFRILAAEANPSIVSVVPDSASQQDALTVSVTATGTIFMQGTSNLTLSLDDVVIHALNETIVNDTVLSGDFTFLDTYPTGQYDVNVVNNYAWPSFSLPGGFTLKLFDFIEEKGSHALLTVYPNPTTDLLFIKRNVNTGGTFYLKVYDISGRLLLEEIIENNDFGKQLDLSTFPKGTYLLKIVQDQKEQTEKFVIR